MAGRVWKGQRWRARRCEFCGLWARTAVAGTAGEENLEDTGATQCLTRTVRGVRILSPWWCKQRTWAGGIVQFRSVGPPGTGRSHDNTAGAQPAIQRYPGVRSTNHALTCASVLVSGEVDC